MPTTGRNMAPRFAGVPAGGIAGSVIVCPRFDRTTEYQIQELTDVLGDCLAFIAACQSVSAVIFSTHAINMLLELAPKTVQVQSGGANDQFVDFISTLQSLHNVKVAVANGLGCLGEHNDADGQLLVATRQLLKLKNVSLRSRDTVVYPSGADVPEIWTYSGEEIAETRYVDLARFPANKSNWMDSMRQIYEMSPDAVVVWELALQRLPHPGDRLQRLKIAMQFTLKGTPSVVLDPMMSPHLRASGVQSDLQDYIDLHEWLPDSMLQEYQYFAHLHAVCPALYDGEIRFIEVADRDVVIYVRDIEGQRITVVANTKGRRVTLELHPLIGKWIAGTHNVMGDGANPTTERIVFAAYELRVFEACSQP